MKATIDELPPLKFKDIYLQERLQIRKRRDKQSYSDGREEGNIAPHDCVGLALSGGGIRSATFCLGFLQELHRLKLLRIFDYLSTVSGGGYVAGWWSAWLSRDEKMARSRDESPLLKRKDIHNPSMLVARIIDGGDPVSKQLLEQMQSSKHGLDTFLQLAKHREEHCPSRELLDKLLEELNTYICKHSEPSLSELSTTSAAPAVQSEKQELEEKARLENQRLWANRLRLEQAFPYELCDIFPPNELIEPERRSAEGSDQGSDGSLCAWKDPIHHLRLFANYLTPRKGMLSADTWRAVSVITRNLTLTWLILLPLLITLMLLGQAYLLLNPATRDAFLCAGSSPCQGQDSIPLVATLAPLAVLLGWSVVMAIGWLICNRENSSPTDWIVQTVCLLALGALVASVVYSIPALSNKVVMLLGPPYRIVLIIWAVITAVFVLFIWHWGLHARDISGKDDETSSRWKKEVRRSRFSRAQAKLLVTTTVVAGVLLISWISSHSFNTKSWTGYLTIPFAIVPLLSAIGGSIFTALRATPTAGGDRSAAREPSMISRFVFAATPGLVIVVLAGLGGIAANRLLRTLTGTQHREPVYLLLSVAAILAIALCVALAVYEMKDVTWSKVRTRSLPSILLIGLLIVNVSWGWQALVYSLVRDSGYPDSNLPLVLLLLPVSAFMAIIITAIVLGRAFSHEEWKAILFRRMKVVGKGLNESQRRRRRALAERLTLVVRPILGISLFSILTGIGLGIGKVIFSKTRASAVFGAVVLSCVSIAGGVILFRLCLVRTQVGAGQNKFELKWFKNNALGKRPEGLWLLAALCLALPVVFICFGHQLMKGNPDYHEHGGPFMLFPINLALLLLVLIFLRSLAIQTLADERIALVGWSKTFFDWVFAKVPRANDHRRRVLQLLAFIALGASIFVDPVAHKISGLAINPIGAFSRANWILMGVVLFVNLPIFGVSLFQIPSDISPSLTFKKWKWPYGRVFLWTLALISILLAVTAGQLLPYWLEHVSEVHLAKGLTPILLPGATGCFLLILFEMSWGERDNRRSLWLIAFAYLGFATIFFMGLTSDDLYSWHVVLGLLAAVVVWVVALGWMVDPNSVSMHQFYRGRLVRAYLGASNIRRRRHGKKEITETVAGDDLPLKSLHNCERGGPYHLINTTLNLVGGRDLATAQRSASSFILSQMHCGSSRTDYRNTEEYMSGQLSLGTAVAASGAAVSPNMGSKKPTAALAMLMTLLNVRLGYWAPTPNREAWNLAQPRLWPFYLLREFFSQTNDVSTYCYLTDGGHFDNTGLYSLIERGCRYIVLVDCGADPRPSCFQDLGEAIRRCRIDFGTEIELSLDSFIFPETKSERCYAVGKIHFSQEHLMALRTCQGDVNERGDDIADSSGTIVYIKPAVVGRVTADVRQYALENDFFPQQTTANQWFDEAQFESYRRLGQFCARSTFDTDAVKRLNKVVRLSTKQIEGIFRELQSTTDSMTD